LAFSGPTEPGGTQRSSGSTQSNCSGTASNQSSDGVLSQAPYRGEVFDTLSQPLAESIAGSKTMLFVINAGGAPTLAQQTTCGSIARIPDVPGASVRSNIVPRLTTSPSSNMDPSDFPTVRASVTWNLTFGAP
jgi:hypothetical protein